MEVIPDDGSGRGPKVRTLKLLLMNSCYGMYACMRVCYMMYACMHGGEGEAKSADNGLKNQLLIINPRVYCSQIQCSMKLVDQTTGEDLDPTNIRHVIDFLVLRISYLIFMHLRSVCVLGACMCMCGVPPPKFLENWDACRARHV